MYCVVDWVRPWFIERFVLDKIRLDFFEKFSNLVVASLNIYETWEQLIWNKSNDNFHSNFVNMSLIYILHRTLNKLKKNHVFDKFSNNRNTGEIRKWILNFALHVRNWEGFKNLVRGIEFWDEKDTTGYPIDLNSPVKTAKKVVVRLQ